MNETRLWILFGGYQLTMNRVIELHKRWTAFSAEKGRERRKTQEQIDANNEVIARLLEINNRLDSDFVDDWRQRKDDLQRERDEAVMEELAAGTSAQAVLRALGSKNTQWIYGLRSNVVTDGRLPMQTNVNSHPEQRLGG